MYEEHDCLSELPSASARVSWGGSSADFRRMSSDPITQTNLEKVVELLAEARQAAGVSAELCEHLGEVIRILQYHGGSLLQTPQLRKRTTRGLRRPPIYSHKSAVG